MPADLRELGVVKVAAPCKRSWDKMSGNEKTRFCGDCQLNVYNLSNMTTEEARELIAQKEGRLCVRFFARADGTVITKNCPKGIARQRRTMAFSMSALGALLFSPLLGPASQECQTSPPYRPGLAASMRQLVDAVKDKLGLRPEPMMGAVAPPSSRVPAPP